MICCKNRRCKARRRGRFANRRAEPRVLGAQEIRPLVADARRPAPFDPIAVYSPRPDVADDDVVLVLVAPAHVIEIDNPAERRAAVRVLDRRRRKAEPIVRLAEARVARAADQLIDGRAMAIGGKHVPR